MATSSTSPTGVEGMAAASPRRGILIVLMTIGLTVFAAMFVQPRVSRWLNIRAAYRDLSNPEWNECAEAVRSLVREGENPDEALIALLSHSDERVRFAAAQALAGRRPVTDRAIDVFLAGLESKLPNKEIAESAAHLFSRHAEHATGPITPTERRMIAWLRQQIPSKDPHGQAESEAYALSTFLHRDPTLVEPLKTYLKGAEIRAQITVTRQMARFDPAFRDQYVQVLLRGASQSVNSNAQRTSIYCLKELQQESGSFLTDLEARLERTTDPQGLSLLKGAIELLKPTAGHQE